MLRRISTYRLRLLQDPVLALGLVLLALFVWLIALPIVMILQDAFTSQPGDGAKTRAADGAMTSYYITRALASRMSGIIFFAPLWNTLVVAVSAAGMALMIGAGLAWMLVRSDLPMRGWFSVALLIPYMLPVWTFALAWVTLFKNTTQGGQPGWMQALGAETPDWLAYGMVPTIIILTLHYIPFAILIIGGALRRVDGQLEEAAQMLGARRWAILWRVTVPVMRPAVLSAGLLMFADAIGEFSVPYILGLPVQFETLSVSLFRAISTQQNGMAAVYATVVLLIGVITLGIDTWMLREVHRFATIGGKGTTSRTSPLRGARWLLFGAVALLFVVSVILPLATLILSTLMEIPGRFSPDNFTLDYWIGRSLPTVAMTSGILLAPEFWHAAWNSLRIAGMAALAAGCLGLLVGYVVARSPWRWLAVSLRGVTFLPYLVPGIAFAAAILMLFAVPRGPVPALYGTPWILLLALVADQMPFSSRVGISAMAQLGSDIEDAARMMGAGMLHRMRAIILPILNGALATAVLLSFISGIKGVSLFILLAVPSTDVLTTFSLRLVDYGYAQAANAVVLVISMLALLGSFAIHRLAGPVFAQGWGR
ncbi:MAG: iron ABC transporter permease [Rhodobacterales bacterium]|nr:iron ABC transporter permease [Rhodobacterales bacterium]